MIRFRNPSSSLESLITIFKQLYVDLADEDYFDNDDIANVLSKANLMASSGFTGQQALEKGANSDRSRDKTYNNAKMHAEIFRLLGLISTVNNSSSNYRFTYIGEHMVLLGSDSKDLVEQCILGMNNPNEIMDVSYNESIRFFSCVLLAMDKLEGYICRDEMIIGPMCVNDNSKKEFENMVQHIKDIRGDFEELQDELETLARKEGIQVNTAHNCTRFPISVLKYCGWVESVKSKIYKKSVTFMKLTAHGKEVVSKLKIVKDIRLLDYESASQKQKEALIRLGTYQMLGRANFNLSDVKEQIDTDNKTCKEIIEDKDILFSPYQTLEMLTVDKALNINIESFGNKKYSDSAIKTYAQKMVTSQQIKIDKDINVDGKLMTNDTITYIRHVQNIYKKYNSVDKTVNFIAEEHIGDTKTVFYPLIETIFRIIGVRCEKTRDGVIGERWDAMIKDSKRSIPIEIKSPTEEQYLSIKAIRQAMENKIVLLSRKTYETEENTTSLAVGYYAPNNRAEVADLINDIKETYGYSIAALDIFSLIRLTVNIIINGKGLDLEKLYRLEGVVDVKDIER